MRAFPLRNAEDSGEKLLAADRFCSLWLHDLHTEQPVKGGRVAPPRNKWQPSQPRRASLTATGSMSLTTDRDRAPS